MNDKEKISVGLYWLIVIYSDQRLIFEWLWRLIFVFNLKLNYSEGIPQDKILTNWISVA